MNPTSNSQDQVRGDGRMLDPNVFMQLMGGQVTNPWNCATSAASAANLVKSCGIMGNFFGNQVAGERSALGLPIDGKLTVFRPTFVNSMNSASVQMASIIGNYLVVRYGAATLMAQTLTPDSQQAGWISDLQSELTTLAKSGKASVTQPVLSPNKSSRLTARPHRRSREATIRDTNSTTTGRTSSATPPVVSPSRAMRSTLVRRAPHPAPTAVSSRRAPKPLLSLPTWARLARSGPLSRPLP